MVQVDAAQAVEQISWTQIYRPVEEEQGTFSRLNLRTSHINPSAEPVWYLMAQDVKER